MGLISHLDLGYCVERGEQGALMHMNDTLRLTFAEIADRIEAGEFDVSDRPPPPYATDDLVAGARATADVTVEIRALLSEVLSRDDDSPPPPLPALIYVYPRRPVLTGAVGRRLAPA
jgi:hypothetical protein